MHTGRRPMAALLALIAIVCVAGMAAAGPKDFRGLLADEEYTRQEAERVGAAYRMAVRAGMDEEAASALVEACLKGRFDGRQLERVLSLAAQVSLASLPVEAFVAKVREGTTKRVKPAKVLEVAQQWALAMRRAEVLLKQITLEGHEIEEREEIFPAVAEALLGGRTEGEVRELLVTALREGERPSRIRRMLLP